MSMRDYAQRAGRFILSQQWMLDLTGFTRGRRAFHRTLRTMTLAVHKFITDRCLLRAAALTLVCLFTLAPALALGFSVAKEFGAQARIKPWIYSQLGLDQDQEDLYGEDRIRTLVDDVLAYIQKTKVAALGAAGLVIVVSAAYSMLASVEKTMNEIWRVRRRRPFLWRVVDYAAIVVAAPLMVILTSPIIAGFSAHAGLSAVGATAPPLLMKFLGAAATLCFATAGLWFLYAFFPYTRVPKLSALVGAVVAAVLWSLVQYLCFKLQVGVAKYSAVYGTFAALPVFLLWIECAWLVVLFGAELSYAHATEGELQHAGLRFTPTAAYRERVAVGIMAISARAFIAAERAPSAADLSREFAAPIQFVRALVADLEEANLLVASRADSLPRYTPAAPPAQITLARILRAAARGEEPPGAQDAFKRLGIADAFSAREQAQAPFLATTLADFVRKQPRENA